MKVGENDWQVSLSVSMIFDSLFADKSSATDCGFNNLKETRK